MKNRIYSLDYLRGIMALTIMVYHFLIFQGLKPDVSGIIEKFAIYGVSIFYILSGLTLCLIYNQKDFSLFSSWLVFLKKRAFRILPLFALVTLIVFYMNGDFSYQVWITLILNITGLFSILNYDGYLVTGGWSIGNELFFYILFPFFILLSSKSIRLFGAVLVILLFIYSYFAYFIIFDNLSLSQNWSYYIHPLNQIFLFASGVFAGFFCKSRSENRNHMFLYIGIMILWVYYPVSGDFSAIISGEHRLLLTILSILTVLVFFQFPLPLPRFIHRLFHTLGEISYGVYLLHPIVYQLLNRLNVFTLNELFYISILGTLGVSYLSYHTLERYFIKLAK